MTRHSDPSPRLVRAARCREQREHALGKTGWCLEVHDLLIAKYVAARIKALRFTSSAARHGLANRTTLLERLAETELQAEQRQHLLQMIERDFGSRQPD